MTTAAQVKRALDSLGNYAAQVVAAGGTNPDSDDEWQHLIAALLANHNDWASEFRLPEIGDMEDWQQDLARWARTIGYAHTSMTRLAQCLCHVDVVLAVADWPGGVQSPLDSWWPQNYRLHTIHVPWEVWPAADGDTENDLWVVQTAGLLDYYGLSGSVGVDEPDLIASLPGRMVAKWLRDTWRRPNYERLITNWVQARREEDDAIDPKDLILSLAPSR